MLVFYLRIIIFEALLDAQAPSASQLEVRAE